MSEQLALYGAPRMMTVKEVAEALGVHIDTIHSWIDKLYPDIKKNGVTTYLDEEQVTRIKQNIGTGRNDLQHLRNVPKVTTELEMAEMTMKVIQYHVSRNKELEAALASAAPKVEMADALLHSGQTMSITDAAKHFGLHPKAEVFPYLRERGYLTAHDLPSQAAIDAGYLRLCEVRCPDGEVRRQAVVPVARLDVWRLRVVPQIAHWKAEALA